MKARFLVIALICFFVFHAQARDSQLKANVATIDITPPIDMKYTLGGYGERMNKPAVAIHDKILAKALVLVKDNRKYAVVTLDLLGLPANVKPDLVSRLARFGWTVDNIMLLPSHSHGSLEMAALNSNNRLDNVNLGIFQKELLDFLINKLEALIIAADKNFQPVKVGTASKSFDGLNRNRRGDPEVEKEMIVTRVDLANGKPLAVLVNWTAHPTFIGGKDMLVSAEWPGYLQSELSKQIGQGVTVMYYNGSEGDQSPVLNTISDPYTKIEVYGKRMAGLAFEVYKEIKTKAVTDFNYSYEIINLPERVAHPSFMKTGGEEYGLTESTVKVVLGMLCPSTVGIGSLRIGDLIIAGVPGEMTAVLGMKIKSAVKKGNVQYVSIGGLANEWISYILSRHQYEHGEGYESSVSFYGAGLGDLISDEVIRNSQPLAASK